MVCVVRVPILKTKIVRSKRAQFFLSGLCAVDGIVGGSSAMLLTKLTVAPDGVVGNRSKSDCCKGCRSPSFPQMGARTLMLQFFADVVCDEMKVKTSNTR